MVDHKLMSVLGNKNQRRDQFVLFFLLIALLFLAWQVSADPPDSSQSPKSSSSDHISSDTPTKINPPVWFSLIVLILIGLSLLNSGMFFFLKKRHSPEQQTTPKKPFL